MLAKRIPDESRYRREMMMFVSKLYERAEGAVAAGASDRAIMLIQQILRADPGNDAATVPRRFPRSKRRASTSFGATRRPPSNYANLEKRELAIHFYKRYLALLPDARDRPSVERAIEKLEAR